MANLIKILTEMTFNLTKLFVNGDNLCSYLFNLFSNRFFHFFKNFRFNCIWKFVYFLVYATDLGENLIFRYFLLLLYFFSRIQMIFLWWFYFIQQILFFIFNLFLQSG